jgi:hypothetical protein
VSRAGLGQQTEACRTQLTAYSLYKSRGISKCPLTFTEDGNVIADEPPSPFETSGHGNWVSTGRRSAAYTFIALIGSAEGPFSAKLKVVGKLRLDADKGTWSGPFRIDVLDPSGQVIFTDRGTFSLTRIEIERLD